mmetsp:Transcript_2069/g.4660  ORF Transcript_2069/g.4660 Transcript_2069/m.4660 type:complete len:100 (+) Transcript_2069:165-464(+)
MRWLPSPPHLSSGSATQPLHTAERPPLPRPLPAHPPPASLDEAGGVERVAVNMAKWERDGKPNWPGERVGEGGGHAGVAEPGLAEMAAGEQGAGGGDRR